MYWLITFNQRPPSLYSALLLHMLLNMYTWSFGRRLLKNRSLACAFFSVRLKFTNFQASSYHVGADQLLKIHQLISRVSLLRNRNERRCPWLVPILNTWIMKFWIKFCEQKNLLQLKSQNNSLWGCTKTRGGRGKRKRTGIEKDEEDQDGLQTMIFANLRWTFRGAESLGR